MNEKQGYLTRFEVVAKVCSIEIRNTSFKAPVLRPAGSRPPDPSQEVARGTKGHTSSRGPGCGGAKHPTHQEKPWAVGRAAEASHGRMAAGVLPVLCLSHVALKVLQLLPKLRRPTPKKAEDELERKRYFPEP